MRNLTKLFIMITMLLLSSMVFAERIKDLSSIAGIRSNQLIGYGLVVGLDGTGDQTSQAGFTLQSFKSMLNQLGVTIPANLNVQLKNVAAVAISAQLPAFAKLGQTIDVTVSSIGNAKSLRGGTLLMSPVKGADGATYAVAQGNLVVGGFGASGSDGSKITVNVPSVGRIPNGATVEKTVKSPFSSSNQVFINLHTADFTTAKRLADAINRFVGSAASKPIDSMTIMVNAPKQLDKRVEFVAAIENLQLIPGDAAAKVIVNSRTGTIVIGQHVKVMPSAVSHGNLTVTISENTTVSQPAPLGAGTTVAVPDSKIQVSQDKNRIFLLDPGSSLRDLVKAMNTVGVAPGDLMAILEALKQAGALKARLVVI